MKTLNFLLVGVGGQGIILASDVLAQVGLLAGYDVKKAEVHGMAQRGGSVVSHVRWGEKVHSPLIGKGEADYLLAFEKLEALRYVEFLRPGGRAFVNDQAIPPVSVTLGEATYPADDQIRKTLEQVTPHLYLVPALRLAEEAGSGRVLNIVLLGVLSCFLEPPPQLWWQAIKSRVPSKYLELNRQAFGKGREAGQALLNPNLG